VSTQSEEDAQTGQFAHLVRLCARGFARSLQLRLVDENVSFGQWDFLKILWQTEGLSQRELADRSGLSEPTVHTALLKLEKLGYVERRHNPGNRRKQHAYLTVEGRRLRHVLEPMAVEVNTRALAGLTVAEQKLVKGFLKKIIGNLARDEEAALAAGRRIPPTRQRP